MDKKIGKLLLQLKPSMCTNDHKKPVETKLYGITPVCIIVPSS